MRSKTSIVSSFSFFLSSYFFHTEAAGGSCGFCISARPNCKGSPPMRCKGGGIPRPLVCNSRVVKIDAATDGTEQRLPLEGGAPRSESKIYMTASGSHTSTMVVRLKPDRMRSKVAILYHPMVIIFSFDLISRN